MNPTPGSWISREVPRPAARVRLICFSYAGIGASVYRLWPNALPATIEVSAVQLPGREARMREKAFTTIAEIVDALVPNLAQMNDKPFAFFGHSMGAIVAFECARALRAMGHEGPAQLFVSSRRPPRIPDPEVPIAQLDDERFVEEIGRRYGGIPDVVRQEPELLALLLGTLRADMNAIETHTAVTGALLSCPITAFGGTSDSHAPQSHLNAWRDETTGAFRVRVFEGGHFYLAQQRAALLHEIASDLEPLTSHINDEAESTA